MLEQLPHPVDAVITSCAGYPLDLTFYQAIKGITAAQHIVKKGGRILLMAECQEGPGAAEFCDMLKKTASGSSFLDLIKEAPVVVDQWQLEKLALVTQKADILFYTPVCRANSIRHSGEPIFSIARRRGASPDERLGPNASIALMPEGPYVLAKASCLSGGELLEIRGFSELDAFQIRIGMSEKPR